MSVDMKISPVADGLKAEDIIRRALPAVDGYAGQDAARRSCLNRLVTLFRVDMARAHSYRDALEYAIMEVRFHDGCDAMVEPFKRAIDNAVNALNGPILAGEGGPIAFRQLSACMQLALREYATELAMLAGGEEDIAEEDIERAIAQALAHEPREIAAGVYRKPPLSRLTVDTRTEAAELFRTYVRSGGDVNQLLMWRLVA